MINPLLNKLQLPPSILKLFEARPPPPFVPPKERASALQYSGIAQFVQFMEDTQPELPEYKMPESRLKRKERISKERKEKHEREIREILQIWDPSKDEKATGDPAATLFVAKMNYETTEEKLKEEFQIYGPIKSLRIVRKEMPDGTTKSRGYAFIEYENVEDIKKALKFCY